MHLRQTGTYTKCVCLQFPQSLRCNTTEAIANDNNPMEVEDSFPDRVVRLLASGPWKGLEKPASFGKKNSFLSQQLSAKLSINPKKVARMEENVQRVTAKTCFGCKQAISSSRVYCGKLRRYVDDMVYCPHFEPEPIEYKLYRRS